MKDLVRSFILFKYKIKDPIRSFILLTDFVMINLFQDIYGLI